MIRPRRVMAKQTWMKQSIFPGGIDDYELQKLLGSVIFATQQQENAASKVGPGGGHAVLERLLR